MTTNATELVTPYLQTLGAGFDTGQAPDGTAVVSTPFRFATGDPVEIAVWEERDGLVLSDRGGLLRSLLVSGIDALDAGSSRTQVQHAIERHGGTLDGATIVSPVGALGAGAAVQTLIQTLMDAQVAAEAVMRTHELSVETETYSTVRSVLDAAEARFRENMYVSGATHRRYAVDFQMAFETSGLVRAVLVVAGGRPLEFAERWNFRFRDIHAARPRLQRVVVVDAQTNWTPAAHKTLSPECEALVPPGEMAQLEAYLKEAVPKAA